MIYSFLTLAISIVLHIVITSLVPTYGVLKDYVQYFTILCVVCAVICAAFIVAECVKRFKK